MKTNSLTKFSKTLFVVAILALGFAKAAAQVALTPEHQVPHASVPGETGPGESF